MSQTEPVIEIVPLKKRLESNRRQNLEILVRIKSPKPDTDSVERPKLNLCIVLDRSGSMAGDKIREAIGATKMCIDNMVDADRLGCVTFDDNIEVLFPNQPVTERQRLHRLVENIVLGGSTALHEAWIKGGLEVTNHFDNAAINRVVLVTDGQANVGERNPSVISRQAMELNSRGVSTTTIGIGDDFNENLLIPMAEAGGGNSWYVKKPEDMGHIFDVELNGLVNQFGHSATLALTPASGVEILDVLNDFEKTGEGRHKLPNLTASNDLEIIVRVGIDGKEEGSTSELFSLDLSFVGQLSGIPERVSAKCEVDFVSADAAALEEESTDAAKVSLFLNNARDRRVATEHLDAGDFEAAIDILRSSASTALRFYSMHPSADVAEDIESLKAELSQMQSRDFIRASKSMRFRNDAVRKGRGHLVK